MENLWKVVLIPVGVLIYWLLLNYPTKSSSTKTEQPGERPHTLRGYFRRIRND